VRAFAERNCLGGEEQEGEGMKGGWKRDSQCPGIWGGGRDKMTPEEKTCPRSGKAEKEKQGCLALGGVREGADSKKTQTQRRKGDTEKILYEIVNPEGRPVSSTSTPARVVPRLRMHLTTKRLAALSCGEESTQPISIIIGENRRRIKGQSGLAASSALGGENDPYSYIKWGG